MRSYKNYLLLVSNSENIYLSSHVVIYTRYIYAYVYVYMMNVVID